MRLTSDLNRDSGTWVSVSEPNGLNDSFSSAKNMGRCLRKLTVKWNLEWYIETSATQIFDQVDMQDHKASPQLDQKTKTSTKIKLETLKKNICVYKVSLQYLGRHQEPTSCLLSA